MNNLNERIRVFADKNKANGITPTGGYLIPYENYINRYKNIYRSYDIFT